ncbi:MAG: hypothetical protein R2881_05670 [Eubacteriales bacterium]
MARLKPVKDEHNRLFHDIALRSLVEQGDALVKRPISNTERAVATRVSAFISRIRKIARWTRALSLRRHGGTELRRVCDGKGIELTIEGDTNDCLGKFLRRAHHRQSAGGRWLVEQGLTY